MGGGKQRLGEGSKRGRSSRTLHSEVAVAAGRDGGAHRLRRWKMREKVSNDSVSSLREIKDQYHEIRERLKIKDQRTPETISSGLSNRSCSSSAMWLHRGQNGPGVLYDRLLLVFEKTLNLFYCAKKSVNEWSRKCRITLQILEESQNVVHNRTTSIRILELNRGPKISYLVAMSERNP